MQCRVHVVCPRYVYVSPLIPGVESCVTSRAAGVSSRLAWRGSGPEVRAGWCWWAGDVARSGGVSITYCTAYNYKQSNQYTIYLNELAQVSGPAQGPEEDAQSPRPHTPPLIGNRSKRSVVDSGEGCSPVQGGERFSPRDGLGLVQHRHGSWRGFGTHGKWWGNH